MGAKKESAATLGLPPPFFSAYILMKEEGGGKGLYGTPSPRPTPALKRIFLSTLYFPPLKKSSRFPCQKVAAGRPRALSETAMEGFKGRVFAKF